MNSVYSLSNESISAHSFNKDKSTLAISFNDNLVHLLSTSTATKEWSITATLSDHDKLVTSIDWAPQSNRIVTCSHDRNAYVWNSIIDPITQLQSWSPTLVLLRLNRSATYVRWSPNETKFAVASGARTIAVCSFDEESDWWVAKQIKKPLRTTVLSLDWHPNSVLLAAGSADAKARVFSAYMKGVDDKPTPTVWGERLPLNTVCGEFTSPSGGWVHGVAFSPSGDALAFTSHDSTITIVYPAGPSLPLQAIYSINLTSLPSLSLIFTSETSLIAAGHDCQPVLFSGSLTEPWQQVKSLDTLTTSTTTASTTGGGGGGRGGSTVGRLNQSEAFNRFREADSRGSSSSSSAAAATGGGVTPSHSTTAGGVVHNNGSTELLTIHQNTITSVRPYSVTAAGVVEKISTTGVDGRLVIWNVDGENEVEGMRRGVGRLGL